MVVLETTASKMASYKNERDGQLAVPLASYPHAPGSVVLGDQNVTVLGSS